MNLNRAVAPVFAVILLAVAGLSNAQDAAPAAPEARHPAFDCSKAKDPERCNARRQEMRERMQEAKKSCEGKAGDERRACMEESFCAKASDPQKCRERADKRADKVKEMKAACGDKQGDALRQCMREQRKSAKPQN